MTEEEILEEIALFSLIIKNIATVGQEYEIGTGSSKRIYEHADLKDVMDSRRQLYNDLANIQNCGGGIVLGF